MKTYTITVNGNVYNVTVEEGVTAGAPAMSAPVAAPKSTGSGAVKVNAPMPGKVVAVKANAGDAVKKGQVILVLEAMKMENDIVAPADGTVASIDTAVGNAVEAGETLATLN